MGVGRGRMLRMGIRDIGMGSGYRKETKRVWECNISKNILSRIGKNN